jgi:glycosyltransferase involved in cell wall biosynthesis
MNQQTVLYIHIAAQVAGGNKVLLGLYEHLDRSRFAPVAILPSAGPMEAELRKADVLYCIVSLDRALRRKSRMQSARTDVSMLAAFLKIRPRILHANGPIGYRFASELAKWSDVLRVCHLHLFSEAEGAVRWAFNVPPHHVITPSRSMARDVRHLLQKLRVDTNVSPVLNSVATERFLPAKDKIELRTGLGLAQFSHLITIVGQMGERKGHPLFIRMAASVLKAFPRAGFLVVGEDMLEGGAYRERMTQLAVELGIRESIVFYGHGTKPRFVLCSLPVIYAHYHLSKKALRCR